MLLLIAVIMIRSKIIILNYKKFNTKIVSIFPQQGMHFLQNSPVHIHGNLKSSNVLIDSRWTSKLTDHGLFLFKEGQEVDVEAGTETKYYGTL